MNTNLGRTRVSIDHAHTLSPPILRANSKATKAILTVSRTCDMNKEKTDRGSTWEEEKVFSLIDIWADEKIQRALDSCSRKKPIFENMATRLEEVGFIRTSNQIREKMKQLKQKYRKIKDNNNSHTVEQNSVCTTSQHFHWNICRPFCYKYSNCACEVN